MRSKVNSAVTIAPITTSAITASAAENLVATERPLIVPDSGIRAYLTGGA
jgi:hypothetical protein